MGGASAFLPCLVLKVQRESSHQGNPNIGLSVPLGCATSDADRMGAKPLPVFLRDVGKHRLGASAGEKDQWPAPP